MSRTYKILCTKIEFNVHTKVKAEIVRVEGPIMIFDNFLSPYHALQVFVQFKKFYLKSGFYRLLLKVLFFIMLKDHGYDQHTKFTLKPS